MERRKMIIGNRRLVTVATPTAAAAVMAAMAAVRVMLLTVILTVFLTVLLGFSTQAQTLNVTGENWTVTVPPITEAGADYAGTYTNPVDLMLEGEMPRSLLNILSGNVLQITVNYSVPDWHSSLRLEVKRTGGEAKIGGICLLCTASINGGLSYQEIPTNSAIQLFTISSSGLLGIGNDIEFSDVFVQLRLSGVSVTTPVDTYSTDVVFTISAL